MDDFVREELLLSKMEKTHATTILKEFERAIERKCELFKQRMSHCYDCHKIEERPSGKLLVG